MFLFLTSFFRWGQITILDTLSEYTPADHKEGEAIVERVIPRLLSANGAVVLSAVKVCLLLVGRIVVLKRLGPALVYGQLCKE